MNRYEDSVKFSVDRGTWAEENQTRSGKGPPECQQCGELQGPLVNARRRMQAARPLHLLLRKQLLTELGMLSGGQSELKHLQHAPHVASYHRAT